MPSVARPVTVLTPCPHRVHFSAAPRRDLPSTRPKFTKTMQRINAELVYNFGMGLVKTPVRTREGKL